MHKLLEANCDRFDKLLSKSYNVLKIHLQIFFAKQRVKVQNWQEILKYRDMSLKLGVL